MFPIPLAKCFRLLGGLALILGGCTREYVSPIPYERLGLLTGEGTRWQITGRLEGYNGVSHDVYATGEACLKDNYRYFTLDSLVHWHNELAHCSTLDPDSVLGKWSLSDDFLRLRLAGDPDMAHPEYEIRQLDQQTLVLRWSETAVNGARLSETVTLTAQ